jgi:hypothetical protein
MHRQVAVEVAALLVPGDRLPWRWATESPHALNELVKQAAVLEGGRSRQHIQRWVGAAVVRA